MMRGICGIAFCILYFYHLIEISDERAQSNGRSCNSTCSSSSSATSIKYCGTFSCQTAAVIAIPVIV